MPFSALYVRSSILYVIRCLTESQCSLRRTGVICSEPRVLVTSQAAQFCTSDWNLESGIWNPDPTEKESVMQLPGTRLSYIIPETWPKILSRSSRKKALKFFLEMSKILQKLSKISENSQKNFFFLDGDIRRKNEL